MTYLKFHPAANRFPMMSKDSAEFKALVEDIRANGLHERIMLWQEGDDGEQVILDGRHRELACLEAGVETDYDIYEGNDPLGYVISMNLLRRHLSDDQRAVIAAEMIPMLEVEAKQRMSEGGQGSLKSDDLRGRSDQKAADKMKVGRHKVRAAMEVTKADPELAKEVKAGKTPLRAAKKAVTEKKPKNVAHTTTNKYVNKVEALLDAGEIDAKMIAQKAGVAESYVKDELEKRRAVTMSPQLATALVRGASTGVTCIADPEARGLKVTEDGTGYEEDGDDWDNLSDSEVTEKHAAGQIKYTIEKLSRAKPQTPDIKASLVRQYSDRVERGEAKEGPRGFKQLVRDELTQRMILRVVQGGIPPAAYGLNCQKQTLATLREERWVINNLIYVHNK